MTSFSLAITHKPLEFRVIFSLLLIVFLATNHVSGFQYEIGGDKGWVKPDGSELETYDEWAQQHRFHIGDTLYFKYSNDSVLLVAKEDYDGCYVNHPLQSFDNGSTVFDFDHSGFFFFISGEPGHCESGQKVIIWVMAPPSAHHHPILSSPAPSPGTLSYPAPSPVSSTGDDKGGSITDTWGPSPTNSTNKLSVASCFLIVFIGVVMVLYMFMD